MTPAEDVQYGRESPSVLIGIFAISTVIGVALGYALAPESLPLWRTMVGGGLLGFHAAMYPYANRYFMM